MQKQQYSSKKNSLFFYLLALTVFFLMLELSLFIQDSGLYLGDFKLISDRLHLPIAILPGILFYLGSQVFVHLLYSVLIWCVTICWVVAIPRLRQHIEM